MWRIEKPSGIVYGLVSTHSFSSTEITEVEALGISNIFRKLLLFFPPSVLVALPEEMLRQLVDNLTALTCKFAQGAAQEEMVSLPVSQVI